MYYRIALISPFPLAPDFPAWSVYEELRCAGHAVEIVDPQRFPRVLNPDGSLNEPAFALFRATFRPHCVAFEGQSVEEILAACRARCEEGLAAMERPAKRFLVFGYLGKDNFGDEFVFSIILGKIRERWPEAVVTAIGQDPQATFARHGVVGIEPDMKFEMDVLMNGAAALVFMAGIVFDEPFFDWTAGKIELFLNPYSEIPGQVSCVQLAWMHGVPSVYLGIGAGPLSNPDAHALMRLAGLCRPLFAARDAETAELLKAAGVDPGLVTQTADVALSIARWRERFAPADGGARRDVVVALRSFPSVDEAFPRRVAEALDAHLERFGGRVVFLDFAPEDRAIHEETARALKRPGSVSFQTAAREEDVLSAIDAARLVLATRLHGSIIANALGVPSVGFDYSEKVRSHYALMSAEDLLLPMDASAQLIRAALASAQERRGAISRQLAERAEALARESERNFEVLARAVDSHDPRPASRRLYERRHSREAALLEARSFEFAEAQVAKAAAEARAAALSAEIAELRSSTAWKAGRAITALPRAIKDALGHRKDPRA